MIIGLGSDLCNIERIANSLERFGERFENRVFTEIERAKARLVTGNLRLVVLFARKYLGRGVALLDLKAIGTGFKRGVFMKDIGVINAPSGAPTLSLSGGAAIRLAELTPHGHEALIHLTLTDDHPWAQAYVILEARPL